MMKANELLNDTLKILGYSNADGNIELTSRIRNSAVVTVNLVYADLWRICNTIETNDTIPSVAEATAPLDTNKGSLYREFEPIESLSDEIKLPPKALGDVFLYGLAMHIARSENDGDQQQFYATLYNSKRSGLTRFEKVTDVLPRTCG